MAKVATFRAWRYNTGQIQMERVVAPPYDIISPSEQEDLYNRDPHNIIRLELGKEEAGDTETKNKYTRAASTWSEWAREGAIKRDEDESFYLYETVFPDPETGSIRQRLVLFGLIGLEPFSAKVVLPHEKTHAKPKEDRLKLLKAIRTNLSPVFGLYEDQGKLVRNIHRELSATQPLFSFDYSGKERHRLWQIADTLKIESISAMFRSKSILIADGHHRYETALNFRDEFRREHNIRGAHPSDFALMGFVEMEDEGLLIFPIHRLIRNLEAVHAEEFIKRMSTRFICEKQDESFLRRISRGDIRPGFGIRLRDSIWYARLEDERQAKSEMPAGKPGVWYQLEVAQISHLVLKHLGIDERNLEHHMEYTRFSEEASAEVKRGEAEVALIVPPIPAPVMREICTSGELMPQKSTYFYPKLGSGFLMHHHGH